MTNEELKGFFQSEFGLDEDIFSPDLSALGNQSEILTPLKPLKNEFFISYRHTVNKKRKFISVDLYMQPLSKYDMLNTRLSFPHIERVLTIINEKLGLTQKIDIGTATNGIDKAEIYKWKGNYTSYAKGETLKIHIEKSFSLVEVIWAFPS